MFSDARSKQVILVSHCVLNQNAKIDRCAVYPGAIREVAQRLLDSGIGILQMPCPEILTLGLDRQKAENNQGSIETEDDRVAELMHQPPALNCCSSVAHDLADQIEQYRKNGFMVLGVLGINGSPTCGVKNQLVGGYRSHGARCVDQGTHAGMWTPACVFIHARDQCTRT